MSMATQARPFHTTRNLRLLSTFMAVARFSPHLAVWVIYLTDYRGLSLAQVGLMETFFQAVKVVGQVPTGAFADRYGRRFTFITGIAIEGTGLLLFGLAGNFPLLVVAYVFWALGITFVQGNDGAYIYDALAAEDRTTEYPSRAGRLLAVVATSSMIGAVAGSALTARTNLAWGVLAGAAPSVPALCIALSMQEPPRRGRVRLPYVATLRGAVQALRARAAVRWAILFEVSLAVSMPASALLLQPFLVRHELPVAWFGVAILPVALGTVGGSMASAWVVRTFGVRRAFALALGGAATSLAVLATVDHLVALLAYPLLRASLGLGGPALGAYVNARTESDVRATVLSVAPLGTALVFSVMAAAAGVIGDRHLLLAYATLATTLIALGGTTYAMWVRADRRESGAD
ncbi:MAG: MFS transporter [Dehalococcoidia bacterium]|nr:MAG: MFS transporter [Dehalococcoidia bacterium]